MTTQSTGTKRRLEDDSHNATSNDSSDSSDIVIATAGSPCRSDPAARAGAEALDELSRSPSRDRESTNAGTADVPQLGSEARKIAMKRKLVVEAGLEMLRTTQRKKAAMIESLELACARYAVEFALAPELDSVADLMFTSGALSSAAAADSSRMIAISNKN